MLSEDAQKAIKGDLGQLAGGSKEFATRTPKKERLPKSKSRRRYSWRGSDRRRQDFFQGRIDQR